MLTINYNHKRFKINQHRFFMAVMVGAVGIASIGVTADLLRFPEKYLTTWKYQLYNEIKAGDTASIEYYNQNYTSKGVYLYGEDGDK